MNPVSGASLVMAYSMFQTNIFPNENSASGPSWLHLLMSVTPNYTNASIFKISFEMILRLWFPLPSAVYTCSERAGVFTLNETFSERTFGSGSRCLLHRISGMLFTRREVLEIVSAGPTTFSLI